MAGKALNVGDYIDGVLGGNLAVIGKAITLVESNSARHFDTSQQVLKGLLAHSGKSVRIAVTGSPGVGKSTFIEALGTLLCNHGSRVAVLAVDPSSSLSRGSILGDKTRMEQLSRHPNAYIRPSPSSGTLGGVTRKTRETIIVCEAAGYDVIFVETIGVGQSEITVRSMVDVFLLLLLPGAGDELQGIKKGIVELADIFIVNKTDGDSALSAEKTKIAYTNAVSLLMPYTEGWKIPVIPVSSVMNEKIENVWESIGQFIEHARSSSIFESRRRRQLLQWVYSMVEDELKNRFYGNSEILAILPHIEQQVLDGAITPSSAVSLLMSMSEP